jgi:hypothetical protein
VKTHKELSNKNKEEIGKFLMQEERLIHIILILFIFLLSQKQY